MVHRLTLPLVSGPKKNSESLTDALLGLHARLISAREGAPPIRFNPCFWRRNWPVAIFPVSLRPSTLAQQVIAVS